MSMGNVKNYILNEDGNYQEYDKMQEDFINPEDLPNEINKALKYNPFLLTHNPNINSEIDSIEEFYININDESKEFGSVIRDDSFSKSNKKRFVKKQLKKWKKEAFQNLKKLIEETKNKFLNTHSERYRKINGYQLFYLILSVILSLLCVFNTLQFINDNIIETIVIIITFALSLVCFVFTFIQHLKIYKFDSELAYHFNEYEIYYKSSKKKIKKSYKKIIKYYAKGYLNSHFQKDPYSIKGIYIDMNTFEKIQANDKEIIKIYNNILKENNGINIFYRLPLICSYVLIALNGGYMVVMLLIHIYKLIFMKGE